MTNVRNSFTAILPAESNCGISSTRFARPISSKANACVTAICPTSMCYRHSFEALKRGGLLCAYGCGCTRTA